MIASPLSALTLLAFIVLWLMARHDRRAGWVIVIIAFLAVTSLELRRALM